MTGRSSRSPTRSPSAASTPRAAGLPPPPPPRHEVPPGPLHPESLRSPIAPLCRNACAFLRADVTGVDLEERVIHTSEGTIGYEYLVLNPRTGASRPHAHP